MDEIDATLEGLTESELAELNDLVDPEVGEMFVKTILVLMIF